VPSHSKTETYGHPPDLLTQLPLCRRWQKKKGHTNTQNRLRARAAL